MRKPVFYVSEGSKALQFAKLQLISWGYDVRTDLNESVTHVLLPVPTPEECIPASLPSGVSVFGGNLKGLSNPAVDFLQDPYYLAENAAITAQCALDIAKEQMQLKDAAALVIGWGRIGKCLALRLAEAGAKVTLAVRKESDCAVLRAMGMNAVLLPKLEAKKYDLIYNTAPAPVLEERDAHPNSLLIDLASKKGIAGERVLWARGLPGKRMPEASGALIAKTALRYALRKE